MNTDEAADLPASALGRGVADIRWLFSELSGTEEGLLRGRTFAFLQDLALQPGASTSEAASADCDTVIYVIEGCGELAHRPTTGSPVLVRPLRPGDAALIEAGELVRLSNIAPSGRLRLMVLGLRGTGGGPDERG
jgi:hypothetical protein